MVLLGRWILEKWFVPGILQDQVWGLGCVNKDRESGVKW